MYLNYSISFTSSLLPNFVDNSFPQKSWNGINDLVTSTISEFSQESQEIKAGLEEFKNEINCMGRVNVRHFRLV